MTDENLLSRLSIDREPDEPRRGSRLQLAVTLLLAAVATALGYLYFFDVEEIRAAASAPVAEASPATPTQSAAAIGSAGAAPEALPATASDGKILDASGYVVAMRVATASSKTVGRIVEVLVEEGMAVHEGQVVARLDSGTELIQLELSRARLERTRALRNETLARLREASLGLERAGKLAAADLLSREDFDNAGIRVEQINAELARQMAEIDIAEQEIRLQQRLIDENVIRAPFAGIVVQKNAQPGEIIAPSTSGGGFTRTGICTIVDMSSLEIEVNVSESFINRVFVGQRAEAILDAYPDFVAPARVSAIVPTADRQRATIKVRVRFDELDPRILPDMGVKVAFFGEEQQAIQG